MFSNELRIGNLVRCDGKVRQIKCVLERGVAFMDNSVALYTELEPEPISCELLILAGYKKVNVLHYGTEVYEKQSSPYFYFYQGELTLPFRTIKIKGIHDFQNVYYTITGEEILSDNMIYNSKGVEI